MTNAIADKYTSRRNGRIGWVSTLSRPSKTLVVKRARERGRGLWLQVYLPVGIAVLVFLLGAAVISYGAFMDLIDHTLLADILVLILLTPALIIAVIGMVLILSLAFVLLRASEWIASLLRSTQKISGNANHSAQHYAHATEMLLQRIHRIVSTPGRAARALRQRLRWLR